MHYPEPLCDSLLQQAIPMSGRGGRGPAPARKTLAARARPLPPRAPPRRAWGAIDAGMVVSRDGLVNQAEGGITQAVSFALHEAVRTEGARVATRGWDTYRTLRFSEAPEVEIALVDRPEEPPLGAGEAFTGPTAGAIGNAVFNAIGLRVRDLPLTRERLIAAIG